MARNKKSANKVRNLALMCCLFGVMLIVGTYAWFIGMQSVSVSQFDVKVAAAEGLELSMDGETWYDSLDAKNTAAYSGNKNIWAEKGLIPMSSVGDTSIADSEMILFEKGSLTATKGGYRLLASRVNYATKGDDLTDGKGYVAFDLFIRNKSGEEYYEKNDVNNEEAIYLTDDSKVQVASAGIDGTGIENSVRVGFVQIGRIEQSTATADQITAIKCGDKYEDNGVTGICRTATIWEPNDKEHVQNAINWYKEACLQRTGSTVVDASYSYNPEVACATVSDDTAYSTYAVANELVVGSNVDVYDGEDFNGYDGNTVLADTYFGEGYTKSGAKLVDMDYFTDSEKVLNGTSRPTFMTLAPNSITKVRVYVWIEGQDIDNYDFSSLGKEISVNFGFTKERFETSEIITPAA